jgi:site-specific DNA-cytosine methylase
MLDLRGPLAKNGLGLVVVELFFGIMAATEALVRDGIKIQHVYACENEAKSRAVAEERLKVLSAIRPEQLSDEAFAECHAFLPQDIKKITRQHIEDMPKPDLVVVGFPCQGFLRASDAPKGLRDPRTKLFEEALRVLQLIWCIHGPCGYLFENVDAIDHPNGEV